MAKRTNKSALEQLREEVRKKHAAATRKIARIERQGINIRGSEFDIRRDIAKARSYNMAQLNAYLYELSGFTDRKTQFVGLKNGAPATREEWKTYAAYEQSANKIGKARDKRVENVFLDFAGMTVKQREAMLGPLEAFNNDTPKPYSQVNRKAQNIADRKALQKLTAQMVKKANEDATVEAAVKLTKSNFRKILKEMGAGDLAKRVNALSTKQADLLFNYSPFANIIANGYGDWKDYRAGGKEGQMAAVVNEQRGDIEEILEWAKKIK